MIHPMWTTFYCAAISGMGASCDGRCHDPGRVAFRSQLVAAAAADLADQMCIEFDKRNEAQSGSPYRG